MGKPEVMIPAGGKDRVAVEQATDEQLATFVSWWERQPSGNATATKYETAYYAAKAHQERRLQSRAQAVNGGAPPAAQAPAQAAPAPAPRQAEPPAAKPASEALTRAEPTHQELALASTYDPGVISERLQRLSAEYHLVAPANEVADLPEGFGVTISLVRVDPNPKAGEVNEIGGKLALSKVAIERIGAAAGVDWDPHLTRRLDNGKDPHYVHYIAVGWIKNFDGTLRRISGTVEIDAREGSPQLDEIKAKAAKRKKDEEYYAKKDNRAPKQLDDGESQTLELRKFILRHAETKAKLRAIVSMGVKRAYQKEELSKPFAVASLIFTGHTNDPELRRTFAIMKAQAALGGAAALFGPPPEQRQLPPSQGHDPPPLGSTVEGGAVIDAEGDDADEDIDLDGGDS